VIVVEGIYLLKRAFLAHDRTIYFPAQEIHFARDDPRSEANAIVANDPRLAAR
jgi:hypothetical protein